MEENNVEVSKFMKSMMNDKSIGFKNSDTPQTKEDSVWGCFGYMSKAKGIWTYALIAFLSIFSNYIVEFYSKFDSMPAIISIPVCIFAIFGYLFTIGYSLQLIKSLSGQQENYTAPKIRFWYSIGQCLKFVIANILGILPYAIAPILLAIIPLPTFIKAILGIALFGSFCFLLYSYTALTWLFANKGLWTAYWGYKEVFALIKENKGRYLDGVAALIVLFILVFSLVFGIIYGTNSAEIVIVGEKSTLTINNIITILIMSIAGTYSTLTFAYICAKCISAKNVITQK